MHMKVIWRLGTSLYFVCAVLLLWPLGPALALAHQGPGGTDVEALGAIVGTWQSDVVDGRSALSTCVWTPQHSAVLCEQTITSSSGQRHALNLYTFEPAGPKYFLYVVPQPGNPSAPVPIEIQGPRWTYGGTAAAPGERRARTINDFSDRDSYSWWTETSTDGEHWTRVTGGRATRVAAR
jgi:hypothetical protein